MAALRRLRAGRQQSGTASLEAIIMLPLMLIMFASVYLMHAHFVGRAQAMARARRCVWVYANEGCKTGDAEVRRHKECLAPPELGLTAEDYKIPSDEEKNPNRYDDSPVEGVGDVLKKIEDIPVLGGAVRWLFGKPVEGKGMAMVQLPAYTMPKQDRFVAAATYYTLCNVERKDWGQVGKDIFCSFVGKGTFGC